MPKTHWWDTQNLMSCWNEETQKWWVSYQHLSWWHCGFVLWADWWQHTQNLHLSNSSLLLHNAAKILSHIRLTREIHTVPVDFFTAQGFITTDVEDRVRSLMCEVIESDNVV